MHCIGKVQSNHLAEAVHKKLDCIGVTVHQGHLLACFAVPQKMVRCCEPSSPINRNTVRHESHNIRGHAQSGDRDTADTDPVWNLFDPVNIEKQGKCLAILFVYCDYPVTVL